VVVKEGLPEDIQGLEMVFLPKVSGLVPKPRIPTDIL
jgi:hypothetical protein